MTALRVRPQAHEDVRAAADYFASEANMDVAIRFVAAVEEAYTRLVQHPLIGTEVKAFQPRLVGMRYWPVAGFDSFLVFYLASPSLVVIVRVLHGARDLPGELGGQPAH